METVTVTLTIEEARSVLNALYDAEDIDVNIIREIESSIENAGEN